MCYITIENKILYENGDLSMFNAFKKYIKKTLSMVTATTIIAVTVFSMAAPVAATTGSTDTSAAWPDAPSITCESAILIDADTGSILYEKDAYRKCYPASTTKILTGLLTIENCNLSDTMTISTNAANSVNPYEDANLSMKAGEQITVEQALYGLLLYSANEIAYALAEQVAGTADAFVDMMNNKAKELGAINTHFANPSGLYNANHYTTAYDMAMIARGCYNNASFVNIDSTSSSYTISATNMSAQRTIRHRHKMLKDREFYYEYCKGGKTGFTDESLMTLVTFAEKDGMRLICVVFRSPDDTIRYTDTRTLFDWGFNNFKKSTTSDSQISSLFSTDNYYSSDVFGRSKLAFNLSASFITIPTTGSTSDVTMDVNTDYDITNNDDKLTAKLNYKYGDNTVGATTLTISSGNAIKDSQLPYLSNEEESTSLSPKRCLKVNIWIVLGAAAGVFIIVYICKNRTSPRNRRNHYSKRNLKF